MQTTVFTKDLSKFFKMQFQILNIVRAENLTALAYVQ